MEDTDFERLVKTIIDTRVTTAAFIMKVYDSNL